MYRFGYLKLQSIQIRFIDNSIELTYDEVCANKRYVYANANIPHTVLYSPLVSFPSPMLKLNRGTITVLHACCRFSFCMDLSDSWSGPSQNGSLVDNTST